MMEEVRVKGIEMMPSAKMGQGHQLDGGVLAELQLKVHQFINLFDAGFDETESLQIVIDCD